MSPRTTDERASDAADTGPPEARIPAGETAHQVSRRSFLGMLGLGAGTVAVVGAGGLTWRAVDQGVFATGTGSAYAAWDGWNPPGGNVLDLVRAAVLAASAHNTQPWRFRVSPTRIDLFADTARNIGTIDPLRRELGLSLGCALENLVLAGPPNGKTPTVTLMPDPSDATYVARVDLASTPAAASPLFVAIPDRHTNRAAYDRGRPVSRATLDGLKGLVDVPDTDVVWFTTAEETRAFGDLTVRATKAIIADPQQAADDFAWYRATWSEIQAKQKRTASPSTPPAWRRSSARSGSCCRPRRGRTTTRGCGRPGTPRSPPRRPSGPWSSLYPWVAVAGLGLDRVLGLTGGLLILAALVVARTSRPAAQVLLLAGALPLAVAAWWSIVAPVVGLLALLLGWPAVRAAAVRPRAKA